MSLARFVALALLLALAPHATASWSAPGGTEPDTTEDATGGRMWTEPPTDSSAPRVYFQAFQAYAQTAASPNTALLGGRVLPAPLVRHHAMLGVWLDCNRDGYVGSLESALQEYRAEVLLESSLCPPGTSPHNDGRWVSEMLAVGMVDPCEYESDEVRARDCGAMPVFAPNERVLYLNGTAVWGDEGGPGDAPTAACVLTPLPRGTTSGSGMLLRYADCHAGRNVAGAVNAADGDGALGLRFEDPERPHESSSALNQPFPVAPLSTRDRTGALGRDGEATTTVWDCSSPKGAADVRGEPAPRDVAVGDPTGGTLTGPRFPLVIVDATKNGAGLGWAPPLYFVDEDGDAATPGVIRVPLADGEGSHAWAPTLAPSVSDHPTNASLWRAASEGYDGARGDCEPGTDGPFEHAHPGERVEKGDATIIAGHKDRTSFVFTFYDGHRGFHPSVDPVTGESTPSDGGLLYRRHDRGGAGPMWTTAGDMLQTPDLLARDSAGVDGTRRFTYYARLGDGFPLLGAALPAGAATFTYGDEACGGARSGERGGWVCDPDAWWLDAQGEPARPSYAQGAPLGAVPGDEYHLRDVDCYDGRPARELPAPAATGCDATE